MTDGRAPRLVLASASAVRSDLLRRAGVSFEVLGSGVDEVPLKTAWLEAGRDPCRIAAGLAEAKARAVAARTPAWVIGADQTAEFEGRLDDKPASLDEARQRLLDMRGRSHRLHSAVHLTDGEQSWSVVSTAVMHMRAFSDAWLDGYLERLGPAALDSVGAYQLEGEGVQLFDRVEGDYFAILGLPLVPLLAALRRFRVIDA